MWSKGQPGSRTRPEPVSVRAAWKPPAGAFEAAKTVTAPGVEAREPALTLSNGGRALVAWSEIAADGSGPLLNYATATEGGSLTVGGPGTVTFEQEGELSGERRVSPAWLPGGKLLLAWDTGSVEYADEIAPGTPPGAGTAIRRDQGESERAAVARGRGSGAAGPRMGGSLPDRLQCERPTLRDRREPGRVQRAADSLGQPGR